MKIQKPEKPFQSREDGTCTSCRYGSEAVPSHLIPTLVLHGGMTSNNKTLDPIRPGIVEVGDGVPSEGVGSLQGQEDKAEVEIDEKEYRAEVEDVRKPKPAA